MSEKRAIVRVDATYHLEVEVGDVVRSGETIQKVPDTGETIDSPVSGTIDSIQFDPATHEFIVAVASER